MAEKQPINKETSEQQRDNDDYLRGGKGRKDEVGRSGIYPASAPNVPADAEVRSPGELGRHANPSDDRGAEEEEKE
jgi:hypothetical protein